ncbi:aspartate-semialdehyde dehydrogenase [Mesobacillus boroniphilus JCM 21738]|uniref:Aspartate-semialdehyde dehydrogenase n=1 Tax=Mesobacillus boroniphilus JCM 21738 TaxID=1294265 RepID=W4RHT6_9BACI|nr:aspartate-semialdehyde dehydrogenase [Mesobacillus boroniphilus JCM 21738]
MVVEGETAMSERKGYRVAVVGATGAVGQQMIHTLESRDFPVSELLLLSSSRSAGTKVQYKGKELTVQELSQKALKV